MGDKRCARCGEVKPRAAFYANRGWRDGLHPYCKICFTDYQRYRRLRKRDLADPERRRWTKWSANHDYFEEIDQPLKAYLLGLLAADGNVLERTPRVSLELAIRDVELVELFRDAIAPPAPIRRRPPRGRGQEQAVFTVTSKQIVTDLARWGIVPRKTWSLRWPSVLPEDALRPYLLGYFDGDGHITIAHRYRGRVYGRWGIVGTRPFVEGAIDYISRTVGIRARRPHEKPGVWLVNIDGVDALAVDDWLHRGFAFGLERKRLSLLLQTAAA